jgi:CBS domain-containing protein
MQYALTLHGRALTWINANEGAGADCHLNFKRRNAAATGWRQEIMIPRQMSEIVRNQNPLIFSEAVTVQQACRSMRDRRVGAALVTDALGELVGIFTGRDAVCRVLAEGLNPTLTALADVMTRDPDVMPPRKNAVEALRMMQDGGYRHVPVVDGKKIIGIVSHGDFRGLEQARLDEETGLWERV